MEINNGNSVKVTRPAIYICLQSGQLDIINTIFIDN